MYTRGEGVDQDEARSLLQFNESMVCECRLLYRYGFHHPVPADAHGLQPTETKAREDLVVCGIWRWSFVSRHYPWLYNEVVKVTGSPTY